MASTWVGGGKNLASDPNNWSPTGVPSSDADAFMTQGTLNIEGSVLASNQSFLFVQAANATINMSGLPVVRPISVKAGVAHINVKDNAQFNLFEHPGTSAIVTLSP